MPLQLYTDVRAKTLAVRNWHDSSYESSEAGRENCYGGGKWSEDKGPVTSDGEHPEQAVVKGLGVLIMLLDKDLPQRELRRLIQFETELNK